MMCVSKEMNLALRFRCEVAWKYFLIRDFHQHLSLPGLSGSSKTKYEELSKVYKHSTPTVSKLSAFQIHFVMDGATVTTEFKELSTTTRVVSMPKVSCSLLEEIHSAESFNAICPMYDVIFTMPPDKIARLSGGTPLYPLDDALCIAISMAIHPDCVWYHSAEPRSIREPELHVSFVREGATNWNMFMELWCAPHLYHDQTPAWEPITMQTAECCGSLAHWMACNLPWITSGM